MHAAHQDPLGLDTQPQAQAAAAGKQHKSTECRIWQRVVAVPGGQRFQEDVWGHDHGHPEALAVQAPGDAVREAGQAVGQYVPGACLHPPSVPISGQDQHQDHAKYLPCTLQSCSVPTTGWWDQRPGNCHPRRCDDTTSAIALGMAGSLAQTRYMQVMFMLRPMDATAREDWLARS